MHANMNVNGYNNNNSSTKKKNEDDDGEDFEDGDIGDEMLPM